MELHPPQKLPVPTETRTISTVSLPSGTNSRRLGLTAATLLFLGLYLIHASIGPRLDLDYCIVIDAGSSGTRLHVFTWKSSASPEGGVEGDRLALPEMLDSSGSLLVPSRKQRAQSKASSRRETEPGLDKFLRKEEQLRQASLGPLLSWALSRVPLHKHSTTPVFLFATAGLRKLPKEHSSWVLDACRNILGSSPFYFRPEFARIITGAAEATFGWVALNYMRGTLSESKDIGTFGALDLGGSSMEVTFELPQAQGLHYPSSSVTLGSEHLSLFARSFEGYGMNDAFDWTVGILLQRNQDKQSQESETGSAGSAEQRQLRQHDGQAEAEAGSEDNDVKLEHPCLHEGYKGWHVLKLKEVVETQENSSSHAADRPLQVHLSGKPSLEDCRSLAKAAVHRNVSGENPCSLPECVLGMHFQPPYKGTFFALAGFHIVAHFFFHAFPSGARDPTKNLGLADILDRGGRYCGVPFKEAQATWGHLKGFEMNCFRAPYVVALLTEGLGLKDDQLVLAEGDGVSWTLGAALLEGLPVIKALNTSRPFRAEKPLTTSDHGTFAEGDGAASLLVGLLPDAFLPLSAVTWLTAGVLIMLLIFVASFIQLPSRAPLSWKAHGPSPLALSNFLSEAVLRARQLGLFTGSDSCWRRWPLSAAPQAAISQAKSRSPTPSPRRHGTEASTDTSSSNRLQARRQSPERGMK